LAAAAIGGALVRPEAARSVTPDIVIPAPYFAQGASTLGPTTNCGPAVVAAAVNYSGVAFPSVDDVRSTLGVNGPTIVEQWSWLLDVYGVPWYATWSRPALEDALRTGHVVVVATWMDDVSPAPDFEQAWSLNWGQPGRYCDYAAGHALLIVGTANSGADWVVHDPNVFPTDKTHWYGDGLPKGAFRRYAADEVWATVGSYGLGLGLAVAPPPVLERPRPVKRVRPEHGQRFAGPGGGHPPRRGVH
jgi:hypothetical protein